MSFSLCRRRNIFPRSKEFQDVRGNQWCPKRTQVFICLLSFQNLIHLVLLSVSFSRVLYYSRNRSYLPWMDDGGTRVFVLRTILKNETPPFVTRTPLQTGTNFYARATPTTSTVVGILDRLVQRRKSFKMSIS